MIGIGAANIAAGLFQGFPVSTSGSRTAVAEQAGAKTQVTGLVGAVAITLMLLLVPGPVAEPPAADAGRGGDRSIALARRYPGTVRPVRQRRTEFVLSIAAFLVSPSSACCRASGSRWRSRSSTCSGGHGGRTRRCSAGRRRAGYHDVRSYPDAALPGCVLFRFDAPLFFANARTFREQIGAAPAIRRRGGSWSRPEPITDVDTTAADMLEDLDEELNERDPPGLRGDEGPGPPQDRPVRADANDRPEHFFPTIDAAGRRVPGEGGATGAEWQPAERGNDDR